MQDSKYLSPNKPYFWVIVILVLLSFFYLNKKTVIIQNDGVEFPAQVGAGDLIVTNPIYVLPDLKRPDPMNYPPKNSCGCSSSGNNNYIVPPKYESIKVDPYIPKVITPISVQAPAPPKQSPMIMVCKDVNYGNKCLTFRNSVADFSTTGLGLNDGTSSMRVVGRWECFDGKFFTGASIVVENEDLANLKSIGFNDKISSIKLLG